MSQRNKERKHKNRLMAALDGLPTDFKDWLDKLSHVDFTRESGIAVENTGKISKGRIT